MHAMGFGQGESTQLIHLGSCFTERKKHSSCPGLLLDARYQSRVSNNIVCLDWKNQRCGNTQPVSLSPSAL